MKHLALKWAVALLACGTLLAGCENDDNGKSGDSYLPPKQTVAAFEQQFPGATNVAWSKKLGYDVATFSLATRAVAGRNSAWYPEGGTSYAYADIEITWKQLQEEAPAVATAWNASPYKTQGYVLDDEIDKRTYANSDPTYKLEIELDSDERDLVYGSDGKLLSDLPDTDEDDESEDEPSPLPILQFITENLPGALIVDSDSEVVQGVTMYEAEVVFDNRECALLFNDKFVLQMAAEEIDDDDYANPDVLPAAVYEKFLALAGDNEIEAVMKCYTSIANLKAGTDFLYLLVVEDEQTDRETVYMTDAEGNLIQ